MEQAALNPQDNVNITIDMLREGQYADTEAQKLFPGQYFDQIHLCALRAWRSTLDSETAQISLHDFI